MGEDREPIIEITPKMLEAGVKAFLRWNPAEDDASWIIQDVFEDMIKAAVSEGAKVVHTMSGPEDRRSAKG